MEKQPLVEQPELNQEYFERLKPVEVFRDGPRYFCTSVTDGTSEFYYKKAVSSEGYLNDKDGIVYTPSEQLSVEIQSLMLIQKFSHLTGDIAPRLLASEDVSGGWYVREKISEGWLGDNRSPFFFNLDELVQTDPAKVARAISSLQVLTSESLSTPLGWEERKANRNIAYLSNAVNRLKDEFNADKLRQNLDEGYRLLSQSDPVLSHGELYPPHIFSTAHGVKFIDWENTRLDHKYADYVKVWIRAFEIPVWQAEFKKAVSADESFDTRLWDAAVLQDCVSLYFYLTEVDQMEEHRRLEAAKFCRDQIRLLSA